MFSRNSFCAYCQFDLRNTRSAVDIQSSYYSIIEPNFLVVELFGFFRVFLLKAFGGHKITH